MIIQRGWLITGCHHFLLGRTIRAVPTPCPKAANTSSSRTARLCQNCPHITFSCPLSAADVHSLKTTYIFLLRTQCTYRTSPQAGRHAVSSLRPCRWWSRRHARGLGPCLANAGPKNPCFRDSFRSRRFVTLGSVPPWLQASDPGPSSDQVNQDFWGRGQAPVLRRASRVSLVYLQGSECHPWKQATRHETETDATAPPCSGLSRVFVGLPRTDALSS